VWIAKNFVLFQVNMTLSRLVKKCGFPNLETSHIMAVEFLGHITPGFPTHQAL